MLLSLFAAWLLLSELLQCVLCMGALWPVERYIYVLLTLILISATNSRTRLFPQYNVLAFIASLHYSVPNPTEVKLYKPLIMLRNPVTCIGWDVGADDRNVTCV